ncbi:MAG: glycosyl hydrolase family 17 protein [Fusobacteriota bacterium]
MNLKKKYGKAFSYGGFRKKTREKVPSVKQIKEDMKILSAMGVKILRTYNTSEYSHAERVLQAIRELKGKDQTFEMYVMLGAWISCIGAETPNVDHSKGNYSKNKQEIDKAIELAKDYPDIVKIIAVGNEAMVNWQVHYVGADVILKWVNYLRQYRKQGIIKKDILITSSDNFATWGAEKEYRCEDLKKLINAVDYISLHTYPFHDTYHNPRFWNDIKGEGFKNLKEIDKAMDEAVRYAKKQYKMVQKFLKEIDVEKKIHIGETGWATKDTDMYSKNGTQAANEYEEKIYYEKMREWAQNEEMLCFYFEAFDEPWKSPRSGDSENHFGVFTVDGKAKYALWELVDKGVFMDLERGGNKITKTYKGDEDKLLEEILK